MIALYKVDNIMKNSETNKGVDIPAQMKKQRATRVIELVRRANSFGRTLIEMKQLYEWAVIKSECIIDMDLRLKCYELSMYRRNDVDGTAREELMTRARRMYREAIEMIEMEK